MKREHSIDLKHMRNDEHFQYFVQFGDTVEVFGVEKLKINPQFEKFITVFKVEDEVLKRIPKSSLTPKINAADKQRDNIFIGLTESCRTTAARHFSEDVRGAANDLLIVFNTYGNLARKPRNEKTSAIFNLLQELKGKHAEDVETAGLGSWVSELQAMNAECDRLMKERWDEAAANTGIGMSEARAAVDAVYEDIIDRIYAHRLLDGDEIFDQFLRRLGVVIDTYNSAIAQRIGRGMKENGDDAGDTGDPEMDMNE